MRSCDRREFLSSLSCTLLTATALPMPSQAETCWLDVAAPFIVEDTERGVNCEIILTSDTFSGTHGHEKPESATDYEIYLYDSSGRAIGKDGVARRLTVPALHTSVIPVRDLIGNETKFWGGMRIRIRPSNGMHASDLFSSAFVRWRTKESFDNVHANPDPSQWQNAKSYYYSMPFPSLNDYDCTLSLFNPYDQPSSGAIVLKDRSGQRLRDYRYQLKPHASLLFNLNSGATTSDPWSSASTKSISGAGLIAIINDESTAKGFAYLMIRSQDRRRFSVEHPIHQSVVVPQPAPLPFDASGQFKARNVLYTPLVFRQARFGGVSFESRCYLASGLSIEETQWLYPFTTDGEGEALWSSTKDSRIKSLLLPRQLKQGIICLGAGESCVLDFASLAVKPGFAGGLGIAVSPDTSHTFMKLELRVQEWGAYAFTHFRPGLRSARLYQKPKERGGLASDYIVSGARLIRGQGWIEADEIIGIVNIDDQGVEAKPTLEVFGSRGLIERLPLGIIPPFACRHFMLSDLIKTVAKLEHLTLRLVDERATLLMSAVHLDYARRDIALDHGSDRFSTFMDFDCS